MSGEPKRERLWWAHPICKVLSGEYTTESFFFVNDEDAVGPLSRTKLTCFCDSDAVWNRKRWAGLEGRHCALSYVGFSGTSATRLLSS